MLCFNTITVTNFVVDAHDFSVLLLEKKKTPPETGRAFVFQLPDEDSNLGPSD